jgi:DNA-binding NtrC family response regulator
MNLLIIDDNPNQLYSLNIALKTRAHRVMMAVNGKEALEILQANHSRIDVVLTDYAMPGMSGLELLAHIQKNHAAIPVIIMTAYGKKELVMAALQHGCAGYVEKPFTLEQLMPEIERVIRKTHRKPLISELTEHIRAQVETVNDKLTVIAGEAEIAQMDLEKENWQGVKQELRDISLLALEIGVANKVLLERMMAGNNAENGETS